MDIPLSILFLVAIVVLAVLPVCIILYHYLKKRMNKTHHRDTQQDPQQGNKENE